MALGIVDLLRSAGIDSDDVMLMKHERGQAEQYQRQKMLDAYTGVQDDKPILRNCRYWMVFLGEANNRARFQALYRNTGRHLLEFGMLPDDYPQEDARYGHDYQYELERMDILREYEERLVVDWGMDRAIREYAARNNKTILSIEEHKPQFPGFDKLIWSFDELSEIIGNPELYSSYYDAMSHVSAVYLVLDKVSGRQYVGSAYGDNGLWGRWSEYVATNGHGHNKLLLQLMSEHPDRYQNLQYTVLRVLDKTTPMSDVIALETQFKDKLGSKAFGLNDN